MTLSSLLPPYGIGNIILQALESSSKHARSCRVSPSLAPPSLRDLPSLPLFCFLQMGKKHSLGALFFLPTPNHLNENMISLSSPTQHSSRGRLLLLSLSFLFVLLVLNEFNPSSPSFLLPSTTTTATLVGEQSTLGVCDSSSSRMRNDSSNWRAGGKKGETEWRISEDHPWIKAKERSKVMLATSQAGNDGELALYLVPFSARIELVSRFKAGNRRAHLPLLPSQRSSPPSSTPSPNSCPKPTSEPTLQTSSSTTRPSSINSESSQEESFEIQRRSFTT